MGNLFFDEPGVKAVKRGPWYVGCVARYIGHVEDFYGLTFKVLYMDANDDRYSCLTGRVMPGNTCRATRNYPEGSDVTIYKCDCELVEEANG